MARRRRPRFKIKLLSRIIRVSPASTEHNLWDRSTSRRAHSCKAIRTEDSICRNFGPIGDGVKKTVKKKVGKKLLPPLEARFAFEGQAVAAGDKKALPIQ